MAFLKGGASTDILDSGELLRDDSFEISDDGNLFKTPIYNLSLSIVLDR